MSTALKVTRENAHSIEIPEPQGPRHRPLNYGSVIDSLTTACRENSIEITRERFQLSKPKNDLQGTCLTGLLNVRGPDMEEGDGQYTIGLLHDNMRRAGLRVLAGKHVFVCDNLMTTGEHMICNKRHVQGTERSLGHIMDQGVKYFKNQVGAINDYEMWLKCSGLSDTEAAAMIYQMHVSGGLPGQYLKKIDRNYFKAEDQPEVERGNRWGLYNACTRELRDLPIHRRIHYTDVISNVLKS